MARTRSRRALAPLAALALGATALAAAGLPGCSDPSPRDCSPNGVRADIRDLVGTSYLFADQVDFGASYPSDPAQFLDALVDSAHGPDAGRHFSYLTTKAASDQFFVEGRSEGYGFSRTLLGDLAGGTGRLVLADVLGDDPAAPPTDQSPAFKAGFARGDTMLAAALDEAAVDAPASQLSAILQAAATTDAGALTAALGGAGDFRPRWFRLLKAGAATPVVVTATRAGYAITPVPRAAAPITFDVPAEQSDDGAKKVAYLALRSFILPAVPALRTAFAKLEADGVTDLIVDLRYDGGGRLEVAADFLELLRAGQGAEPLFGIRHNARNAVRDLTFHNAGEAAAVPARRLAFIVGPGSASASELLPFAMAHFAPTEVALIGDRTLGKPAGQYSFFYRDCPTVYVILSFQLVDAGGAPALYYGGLPDAAWTGPTCAAADDLDHALGDPAEAATGAALQWVKDRSCAGGPIPPAALAALWSGPAPAAALPEDPEPGLAERHLPGLH